MSGTGKYAECVTMSEWVTNPLVRPKMSKNTPNVWQLAGMQEDTLALADRLRYSAKFA